MAQTHHLSPARITRYTAHLREQERAPATIRKYAHDLTALMSWLGGRELTKSALLEWKEHLAQSYAARSANTMIAALNGFLVYCGWGDFKVKPFRIQKSLFCSEDKEPSREEYIRLVKAAQRKDNERLSLVIQTICATGIRVSELRHITAEAVQAGRAEVNNKGKRRIVFLPKQLRRLLIKYLRKQKITAGAVFLSKNGRPLDRSNIWRDMKALCESVHVDSGKVFPHNLRH